MADVNKSGACSEVEEADSMSNIPSGDEHNRCRKALANAGAGVNILGEDGRTALMYAISEDHTQCINEVIKAGADVNVVDNHGLTPLILAIDKGNLKIVDILIKAGANVNRKGQDENSPLQFAVYKANEECLKLLLDAGADVNIVNEKGNSPLLTLLEANSMGKLGETLIKPENFEENKVGKRALIRTADIARTLHLLLAAGADVNIKNKMHACALHCAAFNDDYMSIEKLLKAGADVNSSDIKGHTPLITAMSMWGKDRTQSVNMLIEAGADVNAQTLSGTTALTYIVMFNHVKCLKILIEAGADVNAVSDEEGRTALFLALRQDRYKCTDLLLEAGADVNITDNDGNTALHIDLEYHGYYVDYVKNYRRYVKKLLRARIHINKFNKSRGLNTLQTLVEYKYKYQDFDHITKINYKEPIMFLYAAGETIDGAEEEKIPEELKFEEEKLELKHMCRMSIREHLLKLDLHSNLFGRVPRLGLPSVETEYLLFNQSLDDDTDNSDDDTNDSDDDDPWW